MKNIHENDIHDRFLIQMIDFIYIFSSFRIDEVHIYALRIAYRMNGENEDWKRENDRCDAAFLME